MNRLLLLAGMGLFLLACRKDHKDESLCFDGIVKWGGDPAADGFGWTVCADDSTAGYRSYIPQNLSDDFKVDGLKVSVCLYETDEKFHCECARPLNKYRITSIHRR